VLWLKGVSAAPVSCMRTAALHVSSAHCGVSAVLDAARAHAAVYLTADDVIAATRDTMEATLDYLAQKYGDIDSYAREARALREIAHQLSGKRGRQPGSRTWGSCLCSCSNCSCAAVGEPPGAWSLPRDCQAGSGRPVTVPEAWRDSSAVPRAWLFP